MDPRVGLDGCGKSRPTPEFDPLTSSPYLCVIFLYGRETWSVAIREEYHLMAFENGVLRKTVKAAKSEEVRGD